MPFDPNGWKRAALAHYRSLSELPVPRAKETALALAAAAEAASAGGLSGLHAELQQRLGITSPPAAQPRNPTNRRT